HLFDRSPSIGLDFFPQHPHLFYPLWLLKAQELSRSFLFYHLQDRKAPTGRLLPKRASTVPA
ncbi:MAG: hypothetical protein KDN22_09105, partial [Verrucomicrobiae bacterium]|nr:hypothetical protein [Verrucomicrobiae bacterium]